MPEFALVPTDMSTATTAASGAATDARGANGADALFTLAQAIPGTTTASIMSDLGDAWEAGVDDWCDDAEDYGLAVDATTRDSTATDGHVGGGFGVLRSFLGGGR